MNIAQKPMSFTARVVSVHNIAGEYYLGRFILVDPKEIQFVAGQYIIFHLPAPKLRHTMSIASPPSKRGEIEILQQRVPGGEGSKWFTSLQKGDTVRFTEPFGKFTLQKSDRPKVFVATGSGIAPIRSMIVDHPSGTLYWGLRHETDVFWQDEFAVLARQHPSFQFMITLSKPTDAWKGKRGRVTEHVVRETPDLLHSEFYLCGSRAMIVDMRRLLTQNGVPQGQIYTETFF